MQSWRSLPEDTETLIVHSNHSVKLSIRTAPHFETPFFLPADTYVSYCLCKIARTHNSPYIAQIGIGNECQFFRISYIHPENIVLLQIQPYSIDVNGHIDPEHIRTPHLTSDSCLSVNSQTEECHIGLRNTIHIWKPELHIDTPLGARTLNTCEHNTRGTHREHV